MTTATDIATEPTAEAIEQPAGKLLNLDPTTLLLDGNVRGTPKLDKDFLASIREHGVLVPIVAVRSGASYRVRYGQRRTLAALETSRPTVPVVVVGEDQDSAEALVERIVTQVHENEQRAGLSTVDKANAVEQLSAFGLTATQIHKRLRGRKQDVTDALAVLASPMAMRATARHEFLTLDQAATVADFEDDPDTVKALVTAAKESPGTFEHAAQVARDTRERAQARAALVETLTKAGVRIVDESDFHASSRIQTLDYLQGARRGSSITEAQHASCPGHAAVIFEKNGGLRERFVCADWIKYGHADLYSSSQTPKVPAAEMPPAEREKASAERRQVVANNKAWTSAEKVRRAWLTTFLARKTAPKGAAGFIAAELAHAAHELKQALDHNGAALLLDLLGVKDKAAHLAATERATDGRAQMLSLAFILAAYESRTGTHTWRNGNTAVARYFAFLAANGYELADVEQLCLPKPAKKRPARNAAAATPAPDAASTEPTPAATQPAAATDPATGPEVEAADSAGQVAS